MSQTVVWGSVEFQATKAGITVPSVGDPRQYLRVTDLSGGLSRQTGQHPLSALNVYVWNNGIQTRFPRSATLPYVVTTQTAVTSGADISGFNAANKRLHQVISARGDTGYRWLCGAGTKLLSDTSISNPAIVVRDTFTDVVTAAAEMTWNSTRYCCFGFNNSTDDIKGTTDVSGTSAPSWTTLVALSASDSVYAMQTLSDVGPGVNVLYATYGGTLGLYFVLCTDSVPATPTAIVDASTKDLPGTGSTTYSGLTLPYAGTSHRTADPTAGVPTWSSTASVTAEDSVVASITPSSSTISDPLVAVVDFTSLPRGAEVTGIVGRIVWKQTDAAMDTVATQFQLLVNGSAVGIDRAGELSEPGTTLASQDVGADGDTWGLANPTTDDIRNLGISFKVCKSTGTAGTVQVDDFKIGVYYRAKGTAVATPLAGGHGLGLNPANPSQFAVLGPTAADATGITQPRRLHLYTLSWDSTQARVLATHTATDAGLPFIHDACAYLGGWAVVGGYSNGPGKVLKHVGSDGFVRNLGFAPFLYDETATIVSIQAQNDWLILEVMLSSSHRCWYFYRDGRFYVDTSPQAYTATDLSSTPIYSAEKALAVQQQRIYSIVPNSTSTAAVRQHLPDLSIDPRMVGQSEVRSEGFASGTETFGNAFLYLPELTDGAPQTKKSVVGLEFQGRYVSARTGASYGSVLVDFWTDLAYSTANYITNSATAMVEKEFTTPMQSYDVPGGGEPFKTFEVGIALGHDAASADSPDGLPILLKIVQHSVMLRRFEFEVDSQTRRDFMTLLNDIKTLQGAQITQQLKFGNYDLPAVLDRASLTLTVPPYGAPPSKTDEQVGKNILAFVETEGTTT